MLRLPAFRLDQPATIDEAARILAGEGASEGGGTTRVRVVAGGTDLWPNMKRRHQKAERIVALGGIPELRGVAVNGDVTIGAMERLADLESHPALVARYPALAQAIGSISSPPLRALGTLGGNVCLDTRCTYYDQNEEWRRSIAYCMKAEGTICWVAPSSPRCWAVQSADSAPMLVALGARVRLVSAAGEREIPVEALYRDDGIDYLTKRPDEIVAAIRLPAAARGDRPGGLRTAFFKLRRRGSIDFGVLSVAVALRMEGDVVAHAAIVLGSIASLPSRAKDAERELTGKPLTEESIRTAAEKTRAAATPMDNTDLDPRWRGQVTPVYVARTLRAAARLPADPR